MKKTLLLLLALSFFLVSCNDDDSPSEPTTSSLNLNVSGLEDLGSSAMYEGWIMVDGAPKTTGTFSVDATGKLSESSFEIDSR